MTSKFLKILILLNFICPTVMAQLGESKKDIIAAFGTDYTAGTGDFDKPYISYTDIANPEDRQPYKVSIVFYFVIMDDGDERCSHMKFIYPLSERASLTDYYNKTLTSMDSVTWRDPDTRYLYHIKERYPFCTLMIWLGVDEYSYSSLFGKSKN
ncbi:hypothetical protein [Christiangramia sabulilitoris]|uniref:Uncharacterized protein n=1 Tax=Christiangramia sabulilitoris TaxID=2583991 RepID=A0A550I7Z1_9FLAO|nr:hypothetical protein [Christiangramia sabulilitoris]TRO66938.1 hypothetical protein FGM01_03345 [Christiangramia sabulilitoris]